MIDFFRLELLGNLFNPQLCLFYRSKAVPSTAGWLDLVFHLILLSYVDIITFAVLVHFSRLADNQTLDHGMPKRVGSYLCVKLLHVLDVDDLVQDGFNA